MRIPFGHQAKVTAVGDPRQRNVELAMGENTRWQVNAWALLVVMQKAGLLTGNCFLGSSNGNPGSFDKGLMRGAHTLLPMHLPLAISASMK